jgi:hypothetical protein
MRSATGPQETAHTFGSLSRPVSRPSSTRNSGNAQGSACWTAGDPQKRSSYWAQHQKPGLVGPVFKGFQARVMIKIMTSQTMWPASEPSKLGAISGSTRVIGWFASLMVIFDLSIAGRHQASRGEYLVLREQVLLSHSAVANAAAFPVRSPLAEDEVMAAVILQGRATVHGSRVDCVLRTSPTLFRRSAISGIHARAADHRER